MNREVAEIVQNALLFFDNKRYNLLEWCIMPNHVHTLVTINETHSLSSIVQSWKSFSSKKANRVLERTGAFWMADYYDRYMRDESHLAAVREYIHENPVKCGLVKRANEWEWGSAYYRAHFADGT